MDHVNHGTWLDRIVLGDAYRNPIKNTTARRVFLSRLAFRPNTIKNGMINMVKSTRTVKTPTVMVAGVVVLHLCRRALSHPSPDRGMQRESNTMVYAPYRIMTNPRSQ